MSDTNELRAHLRAILDMAQDDVDRGQPANTAHVLVYGDMGKVLRAAIEPPDASGNGGAETCAKCCGHGFIPFQPPTLGMRACECRPTGTIPLATPEET